MSARKNAVVAKAYVLNLDRAKYRRVAAECAAHGLRAERVEGVDARGAAWEDAVPMEDVTTVCAELCTPAAMAIALGHMRAWRRVADGDDEVVLVLEDDVELAPDFGARLREAVRAVPRDFHVLLLGSLWRMPAGAVNDVVEAVAAFGGTHSYVLSRAGAARLLAAHPRANFHIDIQVSSTPGLRIYATKDRATSNASTEGRDASATSTAGRTPVSIDSYFLHCELLRLGRVRVTPVHVLALLLGALAPRAAPWLAAAAALDALLARRVPSPGDLASKAAFFVAGWALRPAKKRRA